MKKYVIPLLIVVLSVSVMACESKPADKLAKTSVPDTSKYVGKIPAPEFPKGMQWMNTQRPLSLKELRGKIVLLDFWTYGCINCYHVFPTLKKLENEFPNTLVVIGVHSAKFKSSGETKNIRQAILRFKLDHPVVNDRNFKIWKSYHIRAWPSFVLIDPTGKIVGEASGENIYHMMHTYISHMVKIFGKAGKLNKKPLNLVPESQRSAQSVLYFPGKVLADGKGKRLFIADTDHNRIIITSLSGRVEEVIGNGKSGLKNGSYHDAMFNQPQGMTLMGDTLYVADTGNHAVREINLKTHMVKTLAGNGKEARQFNKPGYGTKVSLNSPWALTHVHHMLYVAMAGPHQIWKINPKTAYAQPFAGSGAEGLAQGSRRNVPMAQPSGITTNGKYLYVAEPEASAVQKVGLGSDDKVTTIVGRGLFVYGDKDGVGNQVRLQHDLGIAMWDGKLIVADTYNNKIKLINPKTRRTTTLFGGKEGYRDGTGTHALFNEPGGVSVLGNTLYIADTNNHLIRKANLITHKVTTLKLTGLKKLEVRSEKEEQPGKSVILKSQDLYPGEAKIDLNIRLPKKFQYNTEASNRFILKTANGQSIFERGKDKISFNKPVFPKTISINLKGATNDTLFVDTYAYFCNDKSLSLCLFQGIRYKIPLKITSKGSKKITIDPMLKTSLY